MLCCAALAMSAAAVHAQIAGGGLAGGGGLSGVGGTSYGGVIVARVNVAPYGGGFGMQGGGMGFQGGGMGFQGGGGGGLFGVTRPSFMAEPNTRAAQFFSSAGVRLPVRDVTGVGGTGGAGGYYGAQSQSARPATALLASDNPPTAEQAAEPPAPAVPFAPPPDTNAKTVTIGTRPVAVASPAAASAISAASPAAHGPAVVRQNPAGTDGRLMLGNVKRQGSFRPETRRGW